MKTVLLAIPLLALAACATSDSLVKTSHKPQKKPEYRLTRTSDCISRSFISGFQVLDDRHVLLFGSGGRKAYLVEISPSCFDMAYQHTLATVDEDNNGRICGFGRDSIAYDRMGRVESCRVLGVEELDDERRFQVLGTK